MVSPLPLVHDFPQSGDDFRAAQAHQENIRIRCVLTVASGGFSVGLSLDYLLVVRVFSSTLLPGFIGPES
jgi:hypothetical protein